MPHLSADWNSIPPLPQLPVHLRQLCLQLHQVLAVEVHAGGLLTDHAVLGAQGPQQAIAVPNLLLEPTGHRQLPLQLPDKPLVGQ